MILQIVLTVLFTAVLIEGFIVLTIFLYRTVRDFLKPKKPETPVLGHRGSDDGSTSDKS